MPSRDLFEDLQVDLSLAGQLGFNPFYPRIEARSNGKVLLGGRWYIDFASNDYLGLATDRALCTVYADSIDRFGVSLCGTPVAAGGNETVMRMEERFAAFIGCESVLAFPSCYQANTSLFQAILTKDDRVLVDHFAHASLIEGIRASGCRLMPFVHNDCSHLEKLLMKKGPFRRSVVVTESVFSTEGSIAPFDRINELCREYEALAVVDDSHGVGVIGRNGAGILSHYGIGGFDGIYTASLGKALANNGGIIAAGSNIISALRYRSSGLMYSTGLPPAAAAGVLWALDRLTSGFASLRARLDENRAALSAAIEKTGLRTTDSATPLIAVQCGTMRETILFAKKLYDNGIVATPFVEPSVAPNRGVVRIIPGAGVPLDDCRKAAFIIETFRS